MLEWLYKWVAAVTASGILAAASTALVQSGPLQKVMRMVAGFILILAVISPFAGVDLGRLSFYSVQFDAIRSDYDKNIGQVNDIYIKSIIEERTSEYILNKALEHGLKCTVRVTAKRIEDSYPYPWSVEIIYSDENFNTAALSRIIETDCAIPGERQYWKITR